MKKKKKKGERMGSYKWSFISVSAITTHFSSSAADKLLSSIVFVFLPSIMHLFLRFILSCCLGPKVYPGSGRQRWLADLSPVRQQVLSGHDA